MTDTFRTKLVIKAWKTPKPRPLEALFPLVPLHPKPVEYFRDRLMFDMRAGDHIGGCAPVIDAKTGRVRDALGIWS